MSQLIDSENLIRFAVFLAVLLLMMMWELAAPRRARAAPQAIRWFSNLGVSLLDRGVLQFAVVMGMGVSVKEDGWGLMNWIALPEWVALVSSIVILDLVIYLQHRLFHAVPILWRLHRMHHADIELDVSSGIRFHPGEALVSMLIKVVAVILLAPPVMAIVAFEILLNATSLFNHSNMKLALPLDRVLRWFVVTPDMHRVHHSVRQEELNTNFGFNLPWWDRALGTYRDQPKDGHEKMQIGLEQFRSKRDMRLDQMLMQPFR
jgi:sterol desaturase/sphingolipid hydroxylase (fatty acid hydroxylase superfamily)